MSPAHVNASWSTVAVLGIALGVRVAAWPLVRVTVPPRTSAGLTVSPPEPSGHPDSPVAALVDRDPFRLGRRPASVLYDPVRLAQPTAPRPPLPVLGLVGLAWDGGQDPTALIDGLPGADGARPLRRGDTIAGLRVKSIEPDRVVITGLDTTWTLLVREPWR